MERLVQTWADEVSREAGGHAGSLADRMRGRFGPPTPAPARPRKPIVPIHSAAETRGRQRRWILAAAAVLLIAALAAIPFLRLDKQSPREHALYIRQPATLATDRQTRETTLQTREAGALVYTLHGGNVIVLIHESTELVADADENLRLESGEIWISVEGGIPLSVRANDTTVAVRGTVFGVASREDSVHVAVERGSVAVTGDRETTLLTDGEQVVLRRNAPLERSTGAQTPMWAWNLWQYAGGVNASRFYPSAHVDEE